MDYNQGTIYITYSFKDKNTGQLIQELSLLNSIDSKDRIVKTLEELKEKYSLPEADIIVNKLSA